MSCYANKIENSFAATHAENLKQKKDRFFFFFEHVRKVTKIMYVLSVELCLVIINKNK